ncbi:MAG: hypothetical protein E6J91_09685 [Deltaproteobacteria bacterium]|nr:MAG: hypothetical protein E6J91_09685 [Deltaproteobacteria bacterium]
MTIGDDRNYALLRLSSLIISEPLEEDMMIRARISSVWFAGRATQLCGVALLAAPLWMATACISAPDDGDEVNAQVQEALVPQAGAGCTVLRPVSWVIAGVTCVETAATPIFIMDGDTYTTTSDNNGNFGIGSITLRCSNGSLTTISASCRRRVGGGGGL